MATEGRVALVTGASRGIGQAISARLAAEGCDVALVGRPAGRRSKHLEGSLEHGAELARAMGGGRVHVVEADIGEPGSDRSAIVRDVATTFGRSPDILVHSAAAPREFGDGLLLVAFADTPWAWFTRSVEVNVWAYWDLARAVIPGMRDQGQGWLLCISSRQAAP